MKRILLIGALIALLGGLAMFLLFPTDDLLRSALVGFKDPKQPHIQFRRSALRPWGLSVEDIAIQMPDGGPLLTVARVTIRPTWSALLHFSLRPVHVRIDLCDGHIEGDGDADPHDGTSLDLTWTELHVERCGLPTLLAAIQGGTNGTASLRHLGGATQPQGDGHIEVTAARVPLPDSPIEAIDELLVDRFTSDWRFANLTITLQNPVFKTPDVEGHGQGTIQLHGNPEQSVLQLRFTVTPQPYIRPAVRKLLNALPSAPSEPNARLLLLQGTLSEPQVVRNE